MTRKDSKCSRCDGLGKEADDDLFGSHKKGDECYSCKGTGIDCRYTDALVCPYCGREDSDSWELSESSSNHQCGSCEKNFTYETHTTRTFTASRAECLNGGEHLWGKPMDYVSYFYKRCQACDKSERTQKTADSAQESTNKESAK